MKMERRPVAGSDRGALEALLRGHGTTPCKPCVLQPPGRPSKSPQAATLEQPRGAMFGFDSPTLRHFLTDVEG